MFFRSIASVQTPEHYESTTEFLIFSDSGGMRLFLHALKRAQDTTKTIHLPVTGFGTQSAAAIIIPAAKFPRRPALRMIERPIVIENIASMELVFYGNKLGYQQLSARIEQFLETSSGNIDDHLHISDGDKFVVKRSVSLSIRGPVKRWTKSNLEGWHALLNQKNPDQLPATISPHAITDGKYIPLRPKRKPAAPWYKLWSFDEVF